MTDQANAAAATEDPAQSAAAEAGKTGAEATGAQNGAGGQGAEAGKEGAAGAQAAAADKSGGKATIAGGADVAAEDAAKAAKAAEASKPYWPENWREKMAEHTAAGDKKAYDKELKRLQRVTDPTGIYGNWRELDARLNGGGLVKVPGKDAKPEELAAFHKAVGVPEKAEEYFKDLKLENGVVIGEADKPIADAFAASLHKAGATPAVMKAALDWYYKNQEDAAATLDEGDDTFRRESEKALKDEMGPAFKRQTSAISALFATAPGGPDMKNPNSLYARLMGGRTADNKLIGNDPDMVRFLVGLVNEINPAISVVEDGNQSGLSIDAEIEKIQGVMRSNRREYNQKYATRYSELLAAREKLRARQRA